MPVELNDAGLLPPGLHEYTLDEVNRQFTFSARRQWLWNELRSFMAQSAVVQASHELWIDGSFAEAKPEPRDIDVLFIQWPERLTQVVQEEIARFNAPPFRARLKNHHGIDFNQMAVSDEMHPDWFLNQYGNHWDWDQLDPSPVRKGIILVKL